MNAIARTPLADRFGVPAFIAAAFHVVLLFLFDPTYRLQHQVEQDETGRIVMDAGERFPAVGHGGDMVVGAGKMVSLELGDFRSIFDHQKAGEKSARTRPTAHQR